MCDPITLGIMAASTAASVGGGMLQRSEAADAAANEAYHRNRVLEQYMERQRNLSEQNQKQAAEARAQFETPKQKQTQSQNVEKRTEAIDTATKATPEAVPLAGNAPAIIKSEIANRMLSAFNDATNNAKAQGRFAAYGDTWGQNDRSMLQPGRMIDINNNFSRANTAMLPMEQDLVAYATQKTPSGIGPLLQALGSLGGMVAGGMAGPQMFGAKALGHAVQSTAPTAAGAPWWTASTAFPWG